MVEYVGSSHPYIASAKRFGFLVVFLTSAFGGAGEKLEASFMNICLKSLGLLPYLTKKSDRSYVK